MHQREVALVADGVQRGRGFAEVFGHGRRVADQLVAAGQLEVGEADGAKVVRLFGLLQRACRAARWPATGRRVRRPAVRGDATGATAWPVRPIRGCVSGARPSDGAGLREVVLQEPRLGENHAQRELVLARERRRAQRLLEGLRGLGAATPLERGLCTRHDRLKRHAHHGRQYTSLARLAGPAIPTLV